MTALVFVVFFAGCGSDDPETETCPDGETYNPILATCEPRRAELPDLGRIEDQGGDTQDLGADTGPDAAPDMDPADLGPDLACTTDADQDGAIDAACGGDDCDDQNRFRSPLLTELCDLIDNDCNGEINDGLECGFFAQSDTTLYVVDPFVGEIEERGAVPGLFDIDTHPDGTLYGITSTHLYRYDDATMTWMQFPQEMGNVGTANGMAIDNEGTVYITSGSTLYTANLTTGQATAVGSMGGSFTSSGDCVVTKDNVLLMTSSHTATDSLVQIDRTTGSGQQVGVTGDDEIWGLTAAFGRLYGLTASGRVVEINEFTGESTLIHAYPNVSFYGAASTPSR